MVVLPSEELCEFKHFTVQIQKDSVTNQVLSLFSYKDLVFIAECYSDYHLFFDITNQFGKYVNLTITQTNKELQEKITGLVSIRHCNGGLGSLFYRKDNDQTLYLINTKEEYGLIVERRTHEAGFEVDDNPDAGFHSTPWFEWIVLLESSLVRFPAPYINIHYYMEVVDKD